MGIYANFAHRLMEQSKDKLDFLEEECFTTNKDKIRIDSYQPGTYKSSMIGVPGGAYIEIYDKPDYNSATKVLRLNICYGWIITNHKGKDKKSVWIDVDTSTRKLIDQTISRVEADGETMYSKILKYYNLPEDWPKPDYSKMFLEPDTRTKAILEKEAYKKIEAARKEKEEKERKEALRMKYYGEYL